MSERKYVLLDEFGKYDDVKLAEVIGALENESAVALADLRAELQERTVAALERAAKAGVVLGSKPPAAGASPKKRGPKPKSERETEIDVALEDAEPATISGNA